MSTTIQEREATSVTSPVYEETDEMVLVGALAILHERGWVRRNWSTKHGVCLVGAINEARGVKSHRTINSITDRFARVLGFRNTNDAITWNDQRARSKAAVIRRIERVVYGKARA